MCWLSLERSRQWAVRCMHEASLYDFNSFVTLTYNDENLPEKYPQFAPQTPVQQQPQPSPVEIPNTIPPNAGNANAPGPRPVMFGDRSIMDMANDPVARQQLTAMYQN